MSRILILGTALLAVLGLLVSGAAGQGKGKKGKAGASAKVLPEVKEVFRVSRVGRANVAETRELLGQLYEEARADFDADVRRQRAELEKAYRGEQVRVIQDLGEKDGNGALYLCAYKGTPSVFSIAGAPRKVGELTPALTVEEEGTHETKVTRTITKRDPAASGQPSLEEADEGGAVTFFGIPLVFDDGPSPARKTPKPKGTKRPAVTKEEITEVKTFPKYRASVSKDEIKEGPPLMSQPLFVDLVKNGTVFQSTRKEKRRCQECRGFGRVTDTRPPGQRSQDGRMPCPECKQAGTIEWRVTYVVTW